MFAWNKFELLKKSPELAKLHLATVWESVPSVLTQNKGPYRMYSSYNYGVTAYNLSHCLFGVSYLCTNKQTNLFCLNVQLGLMTFVWYILCMGSAFGQWKGWKRPGDALIVYWRGTSDLFNLYAV